MMNYSEKRIMEDFLAIVSIGDNRRNYLNINELKDKRLFLRQLKSTIEDYLKDVETEISVIKTKIDSERP